MIFVCFSRGQSPAEAEFNFLDHAKKIDMYGVELHKAKVWRLLLLIITIKIMFLQDSTNREIQLGVTHMGLVVCQNNNRINTFSWSKIMKISFKRKQFFIQLIREVVIIGPFIFKYYFLYEISV